MIRHKMKLQEIAEIRALYQASLARCEGLPVKNEFITTYDDENYEFQKSLFSERGKGWLMLAVSCLPMLIVILFIMRG